MAVNETMVSRKEVGDEMGEVLSLPLTLSDESTCLCATLCRLPKRRKPLSSYVSRLLFSILWQFFGLIVQRYKHSLLYL